MSYKICKQNDDRIVLQDTGGIIDLAFGILLTTIGAGVIYLGWFGYQDTGELFMPFIIVLVGSCFFFPMFKNNRLTIDAASKEIIKTKSWFGITTNKEVVTSNALSLLEMSGFTTGELEAFFETTQRGNRHYSLKFYSYPEWQLAIRNFSTMLNIALFIKRHFDTDIDIVIQHQRHKFSALGLLKNHKKTALPNNSLIRESAFQTLKLGGLPLTSLTFWVFSVATIAWAFGAIIFILFFSGGVFDPYVPIPIQYALSALLIIMSIWLVIHKSLATTLQFTNDTLTVKTSPFNTTSYHFSEVIGVTNIAKVTYLITKNGAESLADNIPTKHSYAIHSWLLPFLSK